MRTDLQSRARSLAAYPQLRISKQPGPLEQGQIARFCNGRGTQIGEVFLIDKTSDLVVAGFCFGGCRFTPGEGLAVLEVAQIASQVGDYRRYWRCNGCKRRTRTLLFDGGWACARCHGLLYRSSLISKRVAQWEELGALRREVGQGRPRYMPQRTFAQRAARLEQLERMGLSPAFACVDHDLQIQSDWLWPHEVKRLHHRGFELCNGAIVARRDPSPPPVETPAAEAPAGPGPSHPRPRRLLPPLIS